MLALVLSNIAEALPADEEIQSETDCFSRHPLDPDRLDQTIAPAPTLGGAPLPPGLTAEEKEVWSHLNATFAKKWNAAAGGGAGGGAGGLKDDVDWLALRAGAVANSRPPPVANSSALPPPPVNSSAPPPPAVLSGETSGGGEASVAGGGVERGGHALGGGFVEGLPKRIQDFSVEEVGVWLEGMQLGEFVCQTCLCLYHTTTT